MTDQEIISLLKRQKSGTLSDRERAILESWYNAYAERSGNMLDEQVISDNLQKVAEQLPLVYRNKVVRLWPTIAAVASIVIALGLGVLYYIQTRSGEQGLSVAAGQDIAPGKNGATLTLSDGRKILINDAVAGNIADESGVRISKAKDGQIEYEVLAKEDGVLSYNTLTTTRGEQTQVRLPDGTSVFLNAESSLRYPISFAKVDKRQVTLTGEGYFEVAKDKEHPFIVNTNKQSVEVLGTHFNINAYESNSSVKTTLLEGSVKVANTSYEKSRILRPGQQSQVSGNAIHVADVEADNAVAWKDGIFRYVDVPLGDIMADVSRWYDVDIVYQDQDLKDEKYLVSVNRFNNVSKLLKLLSKTGNAKFEISGRKIVISR